QHGTRFVVPTHSRRTTQGETLFRFDRIVARKRQSQPIVVWCNGRVTWSSADFCIVLVSGLVLNADVQLQIGLIGNEMNGYLVFGSLRGLSRRFLRSARLGWRSMLPVHRTRRGKKRQREQVGKGHRAGASHESRWTRGTRLLPHRSRVE